MKKVIVFAFLFCIYFNAHSQTFEILAADTINFIDVNGKKQGEWIFFGKHLTRTCLAPNQVGVKGCYKDDKKIGKWTEYHCDNRIKSIMTYDNNGKPDGYAAVYYEDGTLKEEGVWKDYRWTPNDKISRAAVKGR